MRLVSSIFSQFTPQVLEKFDLEFSDFGYFRIVYFGVVFDLLFQTFPLHTYFKGNIYGIYQIISILLTI